MARKIHLKLSLEGCLKNKDFAWFQRDDGTRPGKREAEQWVKYQISMGKKFIPVGECEGFSYQEGCPGHEV